MHWCAEAHTAEVAAAAEKARVEAVRAKERSSGQVCAGSSVVEEKLHDFLDSKMLLGP